MGLNVEDVFNDLNPKIRRGEVPAFLNPLHAMLDGKLKRDFTQEHEIGEYYCSNIDLKNHDLTSCRQPLLSHTIRSDDGQAITRRDNQ